MADLKLHQALITAEQTAIVDKIAKGQYELDCLVRYISKFILEDAHLFGLNNLIFRHGMPGKFPNGEYGYLLFGDCGVYEKPDPIEGDYRITMRSPEIPFYEVKLNTLQRIQSKITAYYDRDYVFMSNPAFWQAFHISALARAIPTYLNYLVYSVFIGTEKAKEKWPIKDWLETYIKPTDGNTKGYKFYRSEGWQEINLSKVTTKTKVTSHELDKNLQEINKALRNDERKIEVEVDKDDTLKTDWIKNNVTAAGKKVLALINKIETEVQKALNNGYFDKKYKHKMLWNSNSEKAKKDDIFFEGYNAPIDKNNIAIIMCQDDIQTLRREVRLKEPFTGLLNTNSIADVTVHQTALLDPGEAMVIHKDLLQFWIIPQLNKYFIDKYTTDETRDHIFEISHTYDLVPLFPSLYFKIKA